MLFSPGITDLVQKSRGKAFVKIATDNWIVKSYSELYQIRTIVINRSVRGHTIDGVTVWMFIYRSVRLASKNRVLIIDTFKIPFWFHEI